MTMTNTRTLHSSLCQLVPPEGAERPAPGGTHIFFFLEAAKSVIGS